MEHGELVKRLRSNADITLMGRVRGHFEAKTAKLVVYVEQEYDLAAVAAIMVEQDREALDKLIEKGHVKYVVPDATKAPADKQDCVVAFSDIDDEEDVRVIFIAPVYVIQVV